MRIIAWSSLSLRTKLVVICVTVELLAACLLLLGSMRLLRTTLTEQAAYQTAQITALLDQSIAVPLSQRDYATLQETLNHVRSDDAIVYLVLWDHRDKLAVASGWSPTMPLPARDLGDIDLDRTDTTLHLSAPIIIAGQMLGRVDFGLSTIGLRQARAQFLQRSLSAALGTLLLSAFVMSAFAFFVTRDLTKLTNATKRFAEGELDTVVHIHSKDEIGQLGGSFNDMAGALKQRLVALEHSEQQQRLHLEATNTEKARLATLLGTMHYGILFVDKNCCVIYANPAFLKIWTLSESPIGEHLRMILPYMQAQVDENDVGVLNLMLQFHIDESVGDAEIHLNDGRLIAQKMQIVTDTKNNTNNIDTIWFHEDITQARQTQLRAYQALRDPLTQLLNRRGFYESLNSSMLKAFQDSTNIALMFIDLDNFKTANDLGGHRVGDEVLVAVAKTLTEQMRQHECIARLGGDEFAIICPNINSEEASIIATRLVPAISELYFPVLGEKLRVGCSIGIATYPHDAATTDTLLACADTAMYQSKQAGKNRWTIFSKPNPNHAPVAPDLI